MFIYTVKLLVNESAKELFIKYLHEEHLIDVVNTGCFLDCSLESDIEKNEIIARYRCLDQQTFDKYLLEFADGMRNEVLKRFPDVIIKAERNFCKIIS
ncbi:MAG TPA: DUF4286 family protein [Burkholderiales bacterium]|nr:DUF4286 family protein [Burkholderiales bacterium]